MVSITLIHSYSYADIISVDKAVLSGETCTGRPLPASPFSLRMSTLMKPDPAFRHANDGFVSGPREYSIAQVPDAMTQNNWHKRFLRNQRSKVYQEIAATTGRPL